MKEDDKKILYGILVLWFVQSIGIFAPMRADLEQTIILSWVPGLDATLGIMNLVALYGNNAGLLFTMYLISVVKDAMIAWLGKRLTRHR